MSRCKEKSSGSIRFEPQEEINRRRREERKRNREKLLKRIDQILKGKDPKE